MEDGYDIVPPYGNDDHSESNGLGGRESSIVNSSMVSGSNIHPMTPPLRYLPFVSPMVNLSRSLPPSPEEASDATGMVKMNRNSSSSSHLNLLSPPGTSLRISSEVRASQTQSEPIFIPPSPFLPSHTLPEEGTTVETESVGIYRSSQQPPSMNPQEFYPVVPSSPRIRSIETSSPVANISNWNNSIEMRPLSPRAAVPRITSPSNSLPATLTSNSSATTTATTTSPSASRVPVSPGSVPTVVSLVSSPVTSPSASRTSTTRTSHSPSTGSMDEPYILAEPLSILVDGMPTSMNGAPPGIINTNIPPGVRLAPSEVSRPPGPPIVTSLRHPFTASNERSPSSVRETPAPRSLGSGNQSSRPQHTNGSHGNIPHFDSREIPPPSESRSGHSGDRTTPHGGTSHSHSERAYGTENNSIGSNLRLSSPSSLGARANVNGAEPRGERREAPNPATTGGAESEPHHHNRERGERCHKHERRGECGNAATPSTGNNGAPPGVRVPKDHIFVETEYGSYIIPDYDRMTPELQQRHRDTLTLQFQILNNSWRHYGLSFAMPSPEETTPNLAVRYRQSVRYIMARSGSDIYKLLLVVVWITVEIMCVRIGLKASGYTLLQLKLYDIYQIMLIEMGEAQGFGEGWAPWIRITVLSCVSAVVFILLSTLVGNGVGQSEALTRLLAQFITGNVSNVTTENNEHGVPQPTSELGSLGSMLGGLNLNNVDVSSLLATLGTAFTSNMQRGGIPTSAAPSGPSGAAGTGPSGAAGRRRQRRGPTWRS